ncbi:hypothetical protein SRHO_G00215240 [Serrasalmus rhombeus]
MQEAGEEWCLSSEGRFSCQAGWDLNGNRHLSSICDFRLPDGTRALSSGTTLSCPDNAFPPTGRHRTLLAKTCTVQSCNNEHQLTTYRPSQLAGWAQCEVTGHKTALRFARLGSRRGRIMYPYPTPRKPPVHCDMRDG